MADKDRPGSDKWVKLETSPEYKNNNTLRPWQIEGVSWLTFNWYNKRGCILADEMGLGKTVQTVAMIEHINRAYGRGPFLMVVPLSTIAHWSREFEGWTDLNTVVYQGSKEDREMIREYEWYYRDSDGEELYKNCYYKFHVLICTYESLLSDTSILGRIKWKCLVVDEAHRLKNDKSKLFQTMKSHHYEHRVLLTGTPIQNNLTELFTLLSFIQPSQFSDYDAFSREYGNLSNHEQVSRFQGLLRPFLLRRMKEDVAKKIPAKEETVIEVELTLLQKQYYRAVLEKNRTFLNAGCKSSNVPKLINVVMQLRKVCNHPFLIEGVEDKENKDCVTTEDRLNALVQSSGKLVLVDKLLPKLKSGQHRVLIFSQMKIMLDLIEYYLQLKQYEYERIDGSIRGNERQEAIDRFTREGSTKFVFLLSTRAGGLGINLATADTVIIYDNDWNPQNDMQAMARCHRIGQTKDVKVYRLVTSRTYEQHMFQKASMKLGLDRAVLKTQSKSGWMDDQQDVALSSMDKKEIDLLLKYGAYDLFNEQADKASADFCKEDIEDILERRVKVVKSGGNDDAEKGYTPSSFASATFAASAEDSQIDVNDDNFWEQIIPDNTSADKLTARLDSGEAFQTDESKTELLEDLKARVDEIIALHMEGQSPKNTAEVLALLDRVRTASDNNFTSEQRTQAWGWKQQILHPRRHRRMVERFGANYKTNANQGPPKNAYESPLLTPAERKEICRVVIGLAPLALAGGPSTKTPISAEDVSNGSPGGDGSGFERIDRGWGAALWARIKTEAGLPYRSTTEVVAMSCEVIKLCQELSNEADGAVFKAACRALLECVPASIREQDLSQLPVRLEQEEQDLRRLLRDFADDQDQEDEEEDDQDHEELEESRPVTPVDGLKNSTSLNSIGSVGDAGTSAGSATGKRSARKKNKIWKISNERLEEVIKLKQKLQAEFPDLFSPETAPKVSAALTVGGTSSLPPLLDCFKSTRKMFPSLADSSFQRYVQKRCRRWCSCIKLTLAMMKELDEWGKERLVEGKDPLPPLKAEGEDQWSCFRDSMRDIPLPPPPPEDRAPAWWWGTQDDLDLVLGLARHGFLLSRIRNDPVLCFLGKVGASGDQDDDGDDNEDVEGDLQGIGDGDQPTQSAVASPASSSPINNSLSSVDGKVKTEKKAISMLGSGEPDYGCICGQKRSKRSMGYSLVCCRCNRWVHGACANLPFQPGPEEAQDWICPRCDAHWPPQRAIEIRVRALLDGIGKLRRARTKERERALRLREKEAAKQRKQEENNLTWTKREKVDFVKAVLATPQGTDFWERLRSWDSTFSKKSEQVLKEYYEKLVQQSKTMVLKETLTTQLKDAQEKLEAAKQKKKEDEETRKRIKQLAQEQAEAAKALAAAMKPYCVCGGIDDGRTMIGCDKAIEGCPEWFHVDCVGFTDDNIPDKWECDYCNPPPPPPGDAARVAMDADAAGMGAGATDAAAVSEVQIEPVSEAAAGGKSKSRHKKGSKRSRKSSFSSRPAKALKPRGDPLKGRKERCSSPMTDIPVKAHSRCLFLLEEMAKEDISEPFSSPIDEVALGLPDYYYRIIKPMDFGTIRGNLDRGAYGSPNDFLADVQLVWRNCRTYNSDKSPIVKMMELLHERFKTLCAVALPKGVRTLKTSVNDAVGSKSGKPAGHPDTVSEVRKEVYAKLDKGEISKQTAIINKCRKELSRLTDHEIADESLSSKMGAKLAERVDMLAEIKKVVEGRGPTRIKKSLEQRESRFASILADSPVPEWWSPAVHDVALLVAVNKHGVGNVEVIMSDASFTSVCVTACSDNEDRAARIEWLNQFLRDRSPLLTRLKVLLLPTTIYTALLFT